MRILAAQMTGIVAVEFGDMRLIDTDPADGKAFEHYSDSRTTGCRPKLGDNVFSVTPRPHRGEPETIANR